MNIIETLNRASREQSLPFLVIGGYAVNAHGYPRMTADLDLLIRKEQKDNWKKVVLENGYEVYQERETFMQFSPLQPELIPIDFMLVNEQTFARLYGAAVDGLLSGAPVKHPALLHLIALKLHVVKQELPHRSLRDFNDVLELLRNNKVNVNSAEFKEICDRYGNPKLYEAFVKGTK